MKTQSQHDNQRTANQLAELSSPAHIAQGLPELDLGVVDILHDELIHLAQSTLVQPRFMQAQISQIRPQGANGLGDRITVQCEPDYVGIDIFTNQKIVRQAGAIVEYEDGSYGPSENKNGIPKETAEQHLLFAIRSNQIPDPFTTLDAITSILNSDPDVVRQIAREFGELNTKPMPRDNANAYRTVSTETSLELGFAINRDTETGKLSRPRFTISQDDEYAPSYYELDLRDARVRVYEHYTARLILERNADSSDLAFVREHAADCFALWRKILGQRES